MISPPSNILKKEEQLPRQRLGYWVGLALFFMMLFVPTTYQGLKALLLAIATLAAGLSVLSSNERKLAHQVVLWTAFMVGIGLTFVLIGTINGNPGALRVSTVYILWPALFAILISGINSQSALKDVGKVLIGATLAISIYSLSFILKSIGILPDFLYIDLDQGQTLEIYSGYIEYSLYNVSTLNFLVPFSLSALFIWSKRNDGPVSRKWVLLALALSIILVFVSGRRALWVIVLLSPLISIIFQSFLPRSEENNSRGSRLKTVIGSLAIFVGLYLYLQESVGLNVSTLVETLLQGFDFTNDESGYARSSQAVALLNGWQESPLFGSGHGGAADVTRSDEQPWAYELSYLALLFHTGLVGFLSYSSGIVWIVLTSIKIIREGHPLSQYLIPIMVGFICFLVANATNPYLEKFDYMWVIFLPVAVINIWLIENNHKNKHSIEPITQ